METGGQKLINKWIFPLTVVKIRRRKQGQIHKDTKGSPQHFTKSPLLGCE
jgi:hypothetical protein